MIDLRAKRVNVKARKVHLSAMRVTLMVRSEKEGQCKGQGGQFKGKEGSGVTVI